MSEDKESIMDELMAKTPEDGRPFTHFAHHFWCYEEIFLSAARSLPSDRYAVEVSEFTCSATVRRIGTPEAEVGYAEYLAEREADLVAIQVLMDVADAVFKAGEEARCKKQDQPKAPHDDPLRNAP